MSIEEWAKANIEPNVLALGDIVTSPKQGDFTIWAIGVIYIKNAEGIVSRGTQLVYEVSGVYYIGEQAIENFAPIEEKSLVEEELLFLDKEYGPDGYILNCRDGGDLTFTIADLRYVLRRKKKSFVVKRFTGI